MKKTKTKKYILTIAWRESEFPGVTAEYLRIEHQIKSGQDAMLRDCILPHAEAWLKSKKPMPLQSQTANLARLESQVDEMLRLLRKGKFIVESQTEDAETSELTPDEQARLLSALDSL